MDTGFDSLAAALADRYRLERRLGEGGMAVVYLAEDLKHERRVAIKVLKPEIATAIGAERFLAEIKTTANLQHPHILPLHDSGEADSFLYFVTPYVEGETLRDRLDREKQLPVEDATRLATEVAEALDYAHGRGVIHRDIKPANILLHEGRALVADFGISIAVSTAGGARLTETGLSVGTPQYMSPEQATGDRELDGRSDLYALGCITYEMLAGEPPHTGPTAQAIFAKVLTEEPRPVSELRPAVPGHVAAAVARTLEKLPADRLESAGAFERALGDEAFTHATPADATRVHGGPPRDPTAPARRDPRLIPLMAFAALAAFAAAWAWLSPGEPSLVHPPTRALVDLGDIQLLLIDEVIVSPDGSTFAVTGSIDGKRGLHVRNADEALFRTLVDVGGPSYPDFSPDGNWLVYYNNSDNSVMKIAVSGGAPRIVVPPSSDNPHTPHWGDDGTIVFGVLGDGVYRVPDTGGEATLIADTPYQHPRLLPGGRGVLLTHSPTGTTRYLDLATDTVVDLIPGGVDARYIRTGHLLYADATGGLWAVPFDVGRGTVTGEATPVLDGMTVSGSYARYSVSDNGTLVYGLGPGAPASTRELLVVSLSGEETVVARGNFRDVRWSPNGESVAYSGADPGRDPRDRGIHVYDVGRETAPRRITFGGNDFSPVWAPDGDRIAFTRERDGGDGNSLLVKTVDDDEPPRMILSRAGPVTLSHWGRAGDLLFSRGVENADLWTMQVSDSTTETPFLTSTSDLEEAALSPQGDFVVYGSDESGMEEVYVRSYPRPGQQVIVSRGRGRLPRWSPTGDRIYYWRPNTPGAPDSLFTARVQHDPSFAVLSTEPVLAGEYIVSNWDLHPDGDRFVVTRDPAAAPNTSAEESSEPGRHIVVTNWFEELQAALVAGGG